MVRTIYQHAHRSILVLDPTDHRCPDSVTKDSPSAGKHMCNANVLAASDEISTTRDLILKRPPKHRK